MECRISETTGSIQCTRHIARRLPVISFFRRRTIDKRFGWPNKKLPWLVRSLSSSSQETRRSFDYYLSMHRSGVVDLDAGWWKNQSAIAAPQVSARYFCGRCRVSTEQFQSIHPSDSKEARWKRRSAGGGRVLRYGTN